MTGRPATAENPLRAKALLRARGMSQAQLLQGLVLSGVQMSASSLSRFINYGRVQGFDVESARSVICSTLTDDRACDFEQGAKPFDNFVRKEMLTQQAREFFKIPADPFVASVQKADDVYFTPGSRYISQSLYYCAKNGDFMAVVGESGSGKSTLRKHFIDRISRENEKIVVIQPAVTDKEKLTAEHICEAIVSHFNEAPKRSREALARQIQRLLLGSSKAGFSHVLLIEEAHDLSIKLLKYLKRFWELEDGFKQLLGIALIGQPELLFKLDAKNWEVREVSQRCQIARLMPFEDAASIQQFLVKKFSRIGVDVEQLLEPRTAEAIKARLTEKRGKDVLNLCYPLGIQNLMTRALNQAFELGERRVTADAVGGL